MHAELPNGDADLLVSIQNLIRQLQRPAVTAENELWTSQDIAAYLKLSTYTVERRVVVQPGFPVSMQPCATGAKAAKRWFAGEVITWLRQHRAKLPVARRLRQPA
ncbi:hypothetical protein [Pseudomonas cichorii]|uniref:hypothetical protein n=1 Tax=Pseudomonas cichorii TaxID=36746 RepID=UPI0019104824|nr:hypothetical protein [Pseudomonas cichorii]